MVKDFPNVRSQGNGNVQAQPSSSNSEAPKRNHFYALKARCKQEISLDIMTDM